MLDNHRDFLTATRKHRVVSPEQLLNECTERTYFYRQFFKTHGMKLKGGSKLTDTSQAVSGGSFGFYNPNHEFAARQRQTLCEIEVSWAFASAHYVLIEESSELNSGDDEKLVDYVMSLEQGCMVDVANGIEGGLWAPGTVTYTRGATVNNLGWLFTTPAGGASGGVCDAPVRGTYELDAGEVLEGTGIVYAMSLIFDKAAGGPLRFTAAIRRDQP